jgi:hypothetical protein
MDLQSAQRNYDAQSEPEAAGLYEDVDKTFLAISGQSESIMDEIALYLCNGRDSYARDRLCRRIERLCDDAIEQALERDRKADADAREGV